MYIKFSDNVLNSHNYLCGQHFYVRLHPKDFRPRISIILEKKILNYKKFWMKNFEEFLFFKHFNFSTNHLLFKHITSLAFLALVKVTAGQPKHAASTSKF